MSGYLVAAIVLTAIGAYLIAGRRIAIGQLPQVWVKARDQWSIDRYMRSSVRWQTAGAFLFWPIVLCIRSAAKRMDQVIDAGDPVLLARKIAERDRRIAQLEREAGIRS